LIHEVLAEAITTRLKDPRLGFVTVTGVTVTPDHAVARLRISVLGSEDEKRSALDALESARGFLRTHLAKSLELRTAPELRIELDRGLEHAAHINRLLNELKSEGDS
jgi:ribosome-binding factor A